MQWKHLLLDQELSSYPTHLDALVVLLLVALVDATSSRFRRFKSDLDEI